MPFPEYRRNKSESNPQPIYGAVHKLSYVFAMFFPAGYTVQKKFPNIRAESRYGKLCSCNRYLSSKIVLFLKSKISPRETKETKTEHEKAPRRSEGLDFIDFIAILLDFWCGRGDLNPYAFWAPAPQAGASANFATSALR
jgi:hypothetical protein